MCFLSVLSTSWGQFRHCRDGLWNRFFIFFSIHLSLFWERFLFYTSFFLHFSSFLSSFSLLTVFNYVLNIWCCFRLLYDLLLFLIDTWSHLPLPFSSVIDLVFILMSMLTIFRRAGLFCITTLCSGAGISTIGSTCHVTRSKQLSR